jgi:hypothetical protein
VNIRSLAVGRAVDFIDRGLSFFLYVTYKSKTFPGGRPDQTLLLAAVAYGLAYRIDSTVHCGIRNDAAAPHGRNEIIFADYAVAVLDQVDQKVENLRLKGYRRASRAQFPALAVERKIIEQKQHVAPPQSRLPNHTGWVV